MAVIIDWISLFLRTLIEARFLDVDQLAANRQDRLVTSVAALLGGATGGVTLDNIKLGSSGSRSEQSASLPGKPPPVSAPLRMVSRALRAASRARAAVRTLSKMRLRDRRVLIEVGHQPVVNNRVHDAVDLGVDELHFGLRFEARIRQLDAQHADQTFANVIAGNRRILLLRSGCSSCAY